MMTKTLLPEYAKNARGYLKIEEREALFRLAGNVPDDGVILNIGVEYGASLVCLRAGNLTADLTGVDIDCRRVIRPDVDIRMDVHLITSDSAELLNLWDQPLDLLFVDGDHGYRGVTLDTLWTEWLKPQGVVMFHDCFDWSDLGQPHRLVPGVMQAVTDWYKTKNWASWIEHDPIGTSRLFQRIK